MLNLSEFFRAGFLMEVTTDDYLLKCDIV